MIATWRDTQRRLLPSGEVLSTGDTSIIHTIQRVVRLLVARSSLTGGLRQLAVRILEVNVIYKLYLEKIMSVKHYFQQSRGWL